MSGLSDIQDRADITRLVETFYQRAIPDPVIGYFFTQVVHLDLAAHLPRMVDFWSTMLLRIPAYSGSVAQIHAGIHLNSPISKVHLSRWVGLWCETVDQLFSGVTANLAKERGALVARSLELHLAAD